MNMNDTLKPVCPANKGWFSLILKDPLFHFFILGAVLFSAYLYVNDDVEVYEPKRIVVDQNMLVRLISPFQQTWKRKPTDEEINGLIREYIKEEVLYREALELGLDKDDPVIRRRMRQKMEFLNQDISDPPQATDAILQTYLDKNKDVFVQPPRASFTQVFFKLDSADDIERAKAQLVKLEGLSLAETDIAASGDPTLLTVSMRDASPAEISRVFGQEFAKELFTLPDRKWAGPIRSGFGLHLVFIDKQIPAAAPALEDVRKAVEREWLSEQRATANARFFQILRDRYVVEIIDVDAAGEKAMEE
jgi:parvulin-like peptidyl-prolyl isomerase